MGDGFDRLGASDFLAQLIEEAEIYGERQVRL